MAETEIKKPVARNTKWLMLLLLLVLLALMFLYKKEDGRTYGEDTLVAMQHVTTKLIHKGGEIIRRGSVVRGCVTEDCKERKVAVAAQTGAPKDASAPKNSVSGEGEKAASTPTSVADGASPPAQDGAAPIYPAYPAYPAYPPYAGFSGYGGQSAPDAAAAPGQPEQGAPAGDAGQANQAAQAPQGAPQGAQGYAVPSTPPTPRAAPGGPAYPAYPSYPPYSALPKASGEAPKQKAEQRSQPASVAGAAKSSEPTKEVVKARRAAMQKRYRDAEQEYKKHLAAHPDDMDGFGELGNVYLLAQQYPEAARNYYEAATRLLDGGFIDAVTPLLPIVAQYEPMLATVIRQKIARVDH